jgi:DNA invertase Pin-like site-specific DNA recombinase
MTDYGFIRVSTGSQDLASQERLIKRESPSAIIVRPETTGASASKGQQLDALDALIAKLRKGDRLIVTDSSRLDRRENLWDQLATIMAILATGATVLSLDPAEEDFAVDPTETVQRQKLNALKSKTVKTMTWRGVRSIIDNGAWYGPLPLLWEAVGDLHSKVARCKNPEAVRAIYEAVRDGHSLSSLAREHDSYPQSVRTLIRTRANMTGDFECAYTYQGQKYTWQHHATDNPPVDAELWHAANRVMGERGAIMDNRGGRPVQLATSWVSGLLPCPGCNGRLYVLRGKTLRCGGKGKDRRSCGVSGIPLAEATEALEGILDRDDAMIYRFQRVSGNRGELGELNAELERVRQTLATTEDDDIAPLVARRSALRKQIAEFVLIDETYDMTETGETLADLWQEGSESHTRREILKAVQRYVAFNFIRSEPAEPYRLYQRMLAPYPGGMLVELSDDTCVKFPEIEAQESAM